MYMHFIVNLLILLKNHTDILILLILHCLILPSPPHKEQITTTICRCVKEKPD